MRAAGRSRESGSGPGVAVLRPAAVAPPRDGGDLFVDVRLALGGRIPSHGVEVVREWDLRVIDLFVIGLERSRVNFCVGIAVHVVQRGRPLIALVSFNG